MASKTVVFKQFLAAFHIQSAEKLSQFDRQVGKKRRFIYHRKPETFKMASQQISRFAPLLQLGELRGIIQIFQMWPHQKDGTSRLIQEYARNVA